MRDIDILAEVLEESSDFALNDLGIRLRRKLEKRDKEEEDLHNRIMDEIQGTYGG